MKEVVLRPSERQLKIDYQKELNPEQLEVVLKGDGPCLVLAGAGSGKTRAITYRVAYLLEKGVSADNILLVTFTNKAAKEMLSRVEGLVGSYPVGLWGGTFHSIANRILRMYAPEIGFSNSFTILDQDDAKALIKVCIKELQIDTTARRFPSPAKIHSIISYARNAKRGIADVVEDRYGNFFDIIPSLEMIAESYRSRKKISDSMDFDDLLFLLRDLLYSRADIRTRLAEQFHYVLVDEYQDTNKIQADIIRSLSGVHQNLLVVGDDAQSIYSFRAAEIKNILNFPDVYEKTKTFRLTTNYRSTPQILDLANSSIEKNRDQFKKELTAILPPHEKPNLVPASNANQEAQYISQQILDMRDEGVALNEIAVLFRAAFHSQALEFELMRRDIPYEYRGGLKFFERAHVKDVVSHLRLCANMKDEAAWMRVLGLQNGIGLVTAQKIIAQIREHGTLSDLVGAEFKLGKKATLGWASLHRLIKKLADKKMPSELIREVVTSDYREYLEAEYPDFVERLEDIEQFALYAESYDNLTKFLDEVSLTGEYGALREGGGYQEERIVLSTIHQAKGLEWKGVFVMHLAEGKFPNPKALDEKKGIEEERRLFYVATTRAKKHLYYTYPLTSGHDSLMINQPSMFLQEIPDEMFEQVRLKNKPVRPSWGDYEESTIVFDDIGEEIDSSKKPSSFLRDV
jgi:DNA helicase II / ATP-dependent DNA helicase PcrA